ncbi:hypothetical protein [Streptomyces cellulosae]|uniref:hypothetical protein n=1 Tax=Streptomyces cellulosae TaxID=1968 RepID=UPI0004C68B28|nr:hypothetical protein [Streptomyces cellulosae]
MPIGVGGEDTLVRVVEWTAQAAGRAPRRYRLRAERLTWTWRSDSLRRHHIDARERESGSERPVGPLPTTKASVVSMTFLLTP